MATVPPTDKDEYYDQKVEKQPLTCGHFTMSAMLWGFALLSAGIPTQISLQPPHIKINILGQHLHRGFFQQDDNTRPSVFHSRPDMDSERNITTDGVWATTAFQMPMPASDFRWQLTSGHITIFNWNTVLTKEMEWTWLFRLWKPTL